MPRRRHVTTACNACRESKIKCDGISPTCSNCRSRGRKCHYKIGEDKRQLSQRAAIDLLASRIGQLCQHMVEHGLQPPPMPRAQDVALNEIFDSLELNQIKSNLEQYVIQGVQPVIEQTLTEPRGEVRNAIPEVLPETWSNGQEDLSVYNDSRAAQQPIMEAFLKDYPQSEILNPLLDSVRGSFGVSDAQHISDNSDTNSALDTKGRDIAREEDDDSRSADEVVNQLSDRMGSLQVDSDGQIRYYGPTSSFNLVDMPTPDKLTVHRTVRNDGPEYLGQLGINKDVPPVIEQHLLNLYFTWHDPVLHVVDREMYQKAKDKWRIDMEDTPYYSEALTNAMCCIGASSETRHHPNFITFPHSFSDFFADRAKALLEIELDCPSVATIQAMVVLSGHDIGCKRDARGWLYSGMAMRLAFALGLHMDMTSHVQKDMISTADAEIRRTVFWGCYAVDHLWGFYLGRPFCVNMDDVSVGKPGRSDSPHRLWRCYKSSESQGDLVQDPADLLSQRLISLCEIMDPLGRRLYGSSNISKHELQRLNEETTTSLLQWKENLPPVLQVDPDSIKSYLPHILLLNMQFHQNIIHAHKPWMSKSYIQPQPPQGPGYAHAQKMCIESATTVAKLIHLYERQYGFRHINIRAVDITCSAALILLFVAVFNPEGKQMVTYLNLCFRALDEFGASWERAKHARDFLLTLQSRWEKRARRQGAKRAVSRRNSQGDERKRSRTVQSISPESDIGLGFQWLLDADLQGMPGTWDGRLFAEHETP